MSRDPCEVIKRQLSSADEHSGQRKYEGQEARGHTVSEEQPDSQRLAVETGGQGGRSQAGILVDQRKDFGF